MASRDSGYVENWQAWKTVTECNLHMLTTEDCSDVIFRVGPKRHVVRAHRYVLVSRSCVFHAMFCGPLAEKGEVTIPDIDTHIFKEFLRYVYTEKVDVTGDNATGLLYTSRKYAADRLQRQCLLYLKNSLTEENACTIVEQSHEYGEVDLERSALKVITEASSDLLKSEGFQNLCPKCLGQFLKSESLKVEEENIFTAVMKWAEKECNRQFLKVSPENSRKVLGLLRYEIRFPLMSPRFLAQVVGPAGILPNDERLLIMDGFACKEIHTFPFKSQSRTPYTYIHRFQAHKEGKHLAGSSYDVCFSVNRCVTLKGFQLYGPCKGQKAVYSLMAMLFDNNDVNQNNDCIVLFQHTLLGDGKLNDIFFRRPITLVGKHKYSITVTLNGPSTFKGTGGKVSVQNADLTVTFYSAPSMLCTTFDGGQIPGLIFQ